MIAGFAGILQSDGYAAYRNYADLHPEVVLAACWAHAFRKFRDALEHEPVEAKIMMSLIGELYKLEEKWDEQQIGPNARKKLRHEQSKPIVKAIKAKLDSYAVDMSIPNNDFRAAVNYTAGQWEALSECL